MIHAIMQVSIRNDPRAKQDDYMTITDLSSSAPGTINHIPATDAIALLTKINMTTHATPSFKQSLTYAGYKDVAVNYILCEDDKIIPAPYQEAMIGTIQKAKGSEKDVEVHRINSDHVPNVSHPEELLEIIKKILV
jgi:hypothetical protein